MGFGAPLILIIAGLQLSTPHALIATATALSITTRAISSAVFTAIFSASFAEQLDGKLVNYVAEAALSAGLPAESLEPFVMAVVANDEAALGGVEGVTEGVVLAALSALQQAFADSVRIVFIIAAPFGVVACLLCFFLDDQSEVMNYKVDAPVEDLHARS